MTLRGPVALLLGAAMLAAACGGSTSGPTVASVGGGGAASTPKPSAANVQQLYVRFAQCLRQHGSSVPDPTFDSQGNPQWQVKVDDIPMAQRQPCLPLMQQAIQARGGPAVGGPLTPAQLAQYTKFSQCMRSHGVPNFPDPDPNGGDANIVQAGIDPKSPQVQQAYQQCRPLLPQSNG
jgi:hypothetical protein